MNAKRKRTIAALLAIACFAVVGASLDKGSLLGILDRTRNNKAPSDSRENFFYNRKKPCTSDSVIDRSGFAFVNLRDRIVAVELASGINVTVVEKTPEQGRYVKFSEYASYVYLYDGLSLWRTQVDGKRVSRMADAVIDYEPMGNYVYFLAEKNGAPRLFRSWLTGSGREMLFDHPVHEFRAFPGGVVLMLREPRRPGERMFFTAYDVLEGRGVDLRLPADAVPLWGDAAFLYYAVPGESGQTLYRLSMDAGGGAEKIGEGFVDCRVGPDGAAMLMPGADGADGARLVYREHDSGELRTFGERSFAGDASVDLSWDRVYVTEPAGVHHSPIDKEAWAPLPVGLPAARAGAPAFIVGNERGGDSGRG